MKKGMWWLVIIVFLCSTFTIRAEEGVYAEWQEEFLGELELDEIQRMLNEELEENSFSIMGLMKQIMNGEFAFSKETVQKLLYRLFFSAIDKERHLLLKIMFLVLLGSVFHVFADVFEDGQIANISFYMIYLLLFIFLAGHFSEMSLELEKKLSWFADFMKGLTPAYYMTVAASSGLTSASVFYQGVLLLVWVIQLGLKRIVLPCANLYVLLMFVNHLSKEAMVTRLAGLLYSLTGWCLKTSGGMVAGLQILQNLVAPVLDTLKRGILGKTAGLIPGIGNAVNTVTGLLLTGAVLIRNSLGIAALLVITAVGAEPMVYYIVMSFLFRFLSAAAEPVSDKRIVGCLETMGEGCMLLFRIFFHGELLCVVTFLILTMSFGGHI